MIWGTDDLKIETPFSQGVLRIGAWCWPTTSSR